MPNITITFELPDIIAPVISWVSVDARVTSASIIFSTSERPGVAYWAVSETQLTIEQVEALENTINILEPGAQNPIEVTSITGDTDYFFQVLQYDLAGNRSQLFTQPFTTATDEIPETGIIVYTVQEWRAAVDAGVETLIKVAPGQYSNAKDIVAGKNRTANPLVMIALDGLNKPILIDASQRHVNTEHVTWNGFHCKNINGFEEGYYFWDGVSGASTSSGTRNCKWYNMIFEGTDPGDKNNPAANPIYNQGMVRAFGLVNMNTHSYTIQNVILKFMNTMGDFRFNGTNLIKDIYCEFWYFDGYRYFGQPDTGRVAGFTRIFNLHMLNCLAVYEEEDGTDAPHPDSSQGINTGGTNPDLIGQKVENVLWWRIVTNPGPYRGTIVQNGLTQTLMNNCGHVQCLYLTKADPGRAGVGSPHGLSFEAGANEVLVQNCTLAGFLGYESPWIRRFKSIGTLNIRDNIFRAFNSAASGTTNADRQGFQLVNVNNKTGYVYNDTFNGPYLLDGVEGAMRTFTPKENFNNQGALTTAGAFRELPHAPMGPIEVSPSGMAGLTGGVGKFTINTLPLPHPEFMAENNAINGGTVYTRCDVRYCVADTRAWSAPILNVVPTDEVSVSANLYWVQHRWCIGSGGTLQEGQWSYPYSVVTVA